MVQSLYPLDSHSKEASCNNKIVHKLVFFAKSPLGCTMVLN